MDFNILHGDISKCIPTKCNIKNQCLRYTSEADEYHQSFCFFDKDLEDGEECEFFWDNKL